MIEILGPSPCQMTFGERAALEGVLNQLQPRLSIEIGTAEGGSLQRLARHSAEVHSFDLVRPSLPVDELEHVTLHTGDSHALLPELLRKLEADGRNVDFVLVDGDHSSDGVERDLRDLLASDAVRRTVIVLHDTLNDQVRAGLQRIDYRAEAKVAYVDLDFVGGRLVVGDPFHHELWGGFGIVVVDDGGTKLPGIPTGSYDLFELVAPGRDALVREAVESADDDRPRLELERAREELARTEADLGRARAALDAIQGSPSWQITAPLRAAKRLVRQRLS